MFKYGDQGLKILFQGLKILLCSKYRRKYRARDVKNEQRSKLGIKAYNAKTRSK